MHRQSTHRWAAVPVAAILATLAVASTAPAQIFHSLVSFNGTNGVYPAASLVQGLDGNLYGTTYEGGAHSVGTVFEITGQGALTTLYSFCTATNCTDGSQPASNLVQATDGNLYGTTAFGGTKGEGTVFRITSTGTLTTLHSFAFSDGAYPVSGLIQAPDGNFYGTVQEGGAHSLGTVFKMTPTGTLTTLYNFCAKPNCNDGSLPTSLVQAADGNLYGTTIQGGTGYACTEGCGTVFKITPAGVLMTLHSFDSSDGASPYGNLIQATDGNFYGTTLGGGANSFGTVFKIAPTGTLTTLYSFDTTEGFDPWSGLIQATDGNFYGTTGGGGPDNEGTVFEITPQGTLTTLHTFDGRDGYEPQASLVQATNGTLYGTTYFGGTDDSCLNGWGCGALFSLSVSLGPFAETLPSSGAIGSEIKILGNHLTGASSVTFNGTPATFKVVSSSEISTSVPSGATTGTVQATLPSRTLSSNVPFRVIP